MSDKSYRARAQLYAPRTIEEARAAAQRLLQEGYSDHGVAAALGIAVEQVRRLIARCGDCE